MVRAWAGCLVPQKTELSPAKADCCTTKILHAGRQIRTWFLGLEAGRENKTHRPAALAVVLAGNMAPAGWR